MAEITYLAHCINLIKPLTQTFYEEQCNLIKQSLTELTNSTDKEQVVLTLARTFSKEAGLTSEKQIRNTSWGGKNDQRQYTVS